MVLFTVIASLAVLGTVQGAVTGHFRDSIHLQPSECPPVAAAADFTHTEVLLVQDVVKKTSLNYWPVDLVITKSVFVTSTEYLPNMVTVTPMPPRETVYVTITTPVAKGVAKYYVSNVVATSLTERMVNYMQYVTPSVVTNILPVTETYTHTIVSSFSTTATRHIISTKTEYSMQTTTTHVYDTITESSTVYRTHVITQVVQAPVYKTVTAVGATATVPVLVAASCVPAKGKAGKGVEASVHEKVLRMKEHMRDKFAHAYEDGLATFDFHIDKLRRKLEQSKSLSTSKVSTSYADQPALRKVQNISPLDIDRTKSSTSLLGAGKAAYPFSSASSGKGAGLSGWVADLLSKGNVGGVKSSAGLGSAKGETSDLKAFALPLVESYKTSAVEQLGQGKGAHYR